jgi:hypothetical protein
MNLSFFRRMATPLLKWSCLSLFILGLGSCGGGGGGGDDKTAEPAPKTFDGLVLTLYTGGVELTFLRADGDASTGSETGAVTMKVNPAEAITTSSGDTASELLPSYSISGGRYVYTRTGPEGGTLTVTGEGSGYFGTAVPTADTRFANYFKIGDSNAPRFTRDYAVLFGTDGTYISGIKVNDWGEGTPYPGISWTGATLRVYGGAQVPLAWSIVESALLSLPKLYPLEISQQTMETIPTDTLGNAYVYQFLTSTFTRFSTAEGDFLEKGIGNSQLNASPTLTLINYDYQPDPATINRAVIRIYSATNSVLTYNMTFLDLENGTYVIQEDGTTGTFEFPFLQ